MDYKINAINFHSLVLQYITQSFKLFLLWSFPGSFATPLIRPSLCTLFFLSSFSAFSAIQATMICVHWCDVRIKNESHTSQPKTHPHRGGIKLRSKGTAKQNDKVNVQYRNNGNKNAPSHTPFCRPTSKQIFRATNLCYYVVLPCLAVHCIALCILCTSIARYAESVPKHNWECLR